MTGILLMLALIAMALIYHKYLALFKRIFPLSFLTKPSSLKKRVLISYASYAGIGLVWSIVAYRVPGFSSTNIYLIIDLSIKFYTFIGMFIINIANYFFLHDKEDEKGLSHSINKL